MAFVIARLTKGRYTFEQLKTLDIILYIFTKFYFFLSWVLNFEYLSLSRVAGICITLPTHPNAFFCLFFNEKNFYLSVNAGNFWTEP